LTDEEAIALCTPENGGMVEGSSGMYMGLPHTPPTDEQLYPPGGVKMYDGPKPVRPKPVFNTDSRWAGGGGGTTGAGSGSGSGARGSISGAASSSKIVGDPNRLGGPLRDVRPVGPRKPGGAAMGHDDIGPVLTYMHDEDE
jgi:hypothetical protein